MKFFTTIFPVLVFWIVLASGLKERTVTTLERVALKFYDTNYIANASAKAVKLARGQNFKINFEMTLLQPMYNNFSMKLVNFEFLSNVYKPGIIHVEYDACEALKNPFIRNFVANATSNFPPGCPWYGLVYLKNWEVSFSNLNPGFPLSRHRIDISLHQVIEKKTIFLAEIFVKFENKIIISEKNKKPK